MRQFAAIKTPDGCDKKIRVQGFTFHKGQWQPDSVGEYFTSMADAIMSYTQIHKLIFVPRQPDDAPGILGIFV
jgi:hypothetical protein